MQTVSARAFAVPTLKVILALLFAVGALGWAGYTFVGSSSGEKKSKPKVIATAVDDEGNAVEPNYSKAKSKKQVEAVSDEIESRVSELANAVGAIKTISSATGNDEVAFATVQSLVPIIRGDHDGFIEAIKAMGGTITDLDGEHPLFTHLAKVFEHASVDVDRITVAKYEPPSGGMMRRVVEEDEEGEGEGPNSSMREKVMMLRPQSIFPDAPEMSDESAIEVRVPMQKKGEGESIFSLILTWNKEVRKWQPATFGVVRRELTEED